MPSDGSSAQATVRRMAAREGPQAETPSEGRTAGLSCNTPPQSLDAVMREVCDVGQAFQRFHAPP